MGNVTHPLTGKSSCQIVTLLQIPGTWSKREILARNDPRSPYNVLNWHSNPLRSIIQHGTFYFGFDQELWANQLFRRSKTTSGTWSLASPNRLTAFFWQSLPRRNRFLQLSNDPPFPEPRQWSNRMFQTCTTLRCICAWLRCFRNIKRTLGGGRRIWEPTWPSCLQDPPLIVWTDRGSEADPPSKHGRPFPLKTYRVGENSKIDRSFDRNSQKIE
jgi:hypothetical protein